MCLITFAYRQHERYPFIFAGNRDERFERPTRSARFWEDFPSILAGQDLESGGSWLGVTNGGRFATVTNFRDPELNGREGPSRGELVVDYLVGDRPVKEYMRNVLSAADRYNGFNLLAGKPNHQLYYLSNKDHQLRKLEKGIYGLSNHLLNNDWFKVQKARTGLNGLLKQEKIEAGQLFKLLYDEEKAPPGQLPETGLTPEQEEAASSIFIDSEVYGTRSSTVVLFDREGNIHFEERYHQPGEKEIDAVTRHFAIENDA